MSAPISPHQLAREAQIKALNKRKRSQRTAPKKHSQAEPRLSPTQQVGLKHENQAADHLLDRGLHILQRNVLTHMGEIDIIATDEQSVIFVEVRYRADPRYGGALASVDRAKQRRIIGSAHLILPRLAKRYFNGKTPPYRFDVVAIDGQNIQWITNAFGA